MADESRNQEFVEGSVTRIRLHNFLTYSDAELFPGPRLNLVIGPNGTGKSSIVCALCVGLGGSTKVLGRADKMGDFVQHEKDSGFTEIELYFHKKPVVIRRNIYRDNRSTWVVDGKDASQNKVKEILAKAKIQIDNLCQFLPQDKVGDFSRMTPTQLLKATQAAIGNGELAEQHEEIIKMEKENSTSGQSLQAARTRLEAKKQENAQRQRDVERIREQEARRGELDTLEKKLMWVKYEEQRNQVKALSEKKNALKLRLQKANNAQLGPLKAMLEEQNEAMNDVRSRKTEYMAKKKEIEKTLVNLKMQIDHKEQEESAVQADIQAIKDRHRQIVEKLEREKQKEEKMKNELDTMDEDALRAEMGPLNEQISHLDTQLYTVNSARDTDAQETNRIHHELKRIEARESRLNNMQAQKEQMLNNRDPGSIQALKWIRANSSKFRRKVWGPLALEVQIKDKLYAKYLEDTVQNYLLSAFVTECREDYDTLVRELNEGSRRVGVTVINVQDGKIQEFQRPYTDEQLDTIKREFDMQYYLDEVIRAPDIIHQVLRDHGGIHTMLVGTQNTENIINKGANVFSTLTSMYKKAAFLTPVKKYVSSVSKYGNRATTTRTNDLREPRFLAVSADTQEEMAELHRKRGEYERQLQDLQAKISSERSKEKSLNDEKHAVTGRLNEVREKLRRFQQLTGYLNDTRRRIKNLEAEAAKDVSETEEQHTRKLQNILTKHVKLFKSCRDSVGNLVQTTSKLVEIDLAITASEQRVSVINRIIREEEAKLQQLKADYETVKQSLRQQGRITMELKERAERAAPWERYKKILSELPDDSIELNARIENIRVALSHFRGDLRVVEIYEQVQREIEEEEAELVRLEANFSTLQDRIKAIKDPWYARLKEIVGNINTSFGQYFKDIGCVGEVHLNEEGDISKWGIERRAQFRMTGKLTTMTAEEQSGGEKSVGTIMYLMALQSLTRCPFRVVDEINQGMDIHNERKVFSRITKSSCGSKMPQYFLITPKLITGLQYHPDTKVLVILNGPYNLNQDEWDVDSFITKRRRLK